MRCGLLVFLFLLSVIPVFATPLEAVAGHAVFRTGKDSPYIQLFWEITPKTLHYKKDSLGRLTARVRTQLRISSDTGIIYKDVFYQQTKPFSPDREEAPRILEQERIPAAPGYYTVELFLAEDDWPASRFYYKDTLVIRGAALQYSSLQLLDTFFASDVRSPFLKDGYQQLPRPLNFYDDGQQNVHAYAEIYHTASLPATAFPLKQVFYISTHPGERDAGAYVADTVTAARPVLAFRHTLSTASLPTGNYWLNASLRSASGAELASAATFFQTINKHPAAEQHVAILDSADAKKVVDASLLDLGKTFVAKFSMPQLRAILKMLRPGADAAEDAAIHSFLDQPQDLYMRYLIYNHFSAINPKDPAQAWKDFSDVVREVNHRFGSGSIPGYETDRGIAYLRYGKPDEEVRVPNESGALPYEIWRYNPNQKMHGPGLFLFYSPGAMSSDFRLLHSTVPGETQNPNWRQMLYSTGRSSGNLNARAEEYFGKQ
jgi:GWxTD domain-containing protein